MAKGTELSEFEKSEITALKRFGKSQRDILKALGRSKTVICNYLKSPNNYGTRKLTGRLEKLSPRFKRIGLVSLFNGISTLFRLFNAKAILLEEQQWYYLTHSWEDKGVHTFPKGICPKVNVIARLEYELAYYDSAVHRFNHYTTRTPPREELFAK